MLLDWYLDWFRGLMVESVYAFSRLVFGTLYPAYYSYKAVKTKNVKEYVRWMMYWIVFALFTCAETVSDVFLSWLPLYYEIKIIFVIWLLSPATKGSSILYRKFVHPQLMKREQNIDECIAAAKDKGCTVLMTMGSRGLNYAATTVVQTAIKGQTVVADHLRRSYSMNDISDAPSREEEVGLDETDLYVERRPRHLATSSRENLLEVGRRKRHPVKEGYQSDLYELNEQEEEFSHQTTGVTENVTIKRRSHAQKEAYYPYGPLRNPQFSRGNYP